MEYLSVTKYAELKEVHRNAVYLAASDKRKEIDIDRRSGISIIFMTKKNKDWQPSATYQKNGLKKKTKRSVQ